MKKATTAALMSALLMTSCKEGKVSNIFFSDDEATESDSVEAYVGDTLHLFEEEEPPVALDELFDDFFFNFASDNRFQNQRIHFPLACYDSDTKSSISASEWDEYNKFDTQDFYTVIYEREQDLDLQKDTTINTVTVELLYLNESRMEQFCFNRIDGKWMLAEVRKENVSDTPNGSFVDFYGRFVADSVFQREAIAEPLRLTLTAEGEEDAQQEELTADDWFNMRDDLPIPKNVMVNINYGQTCISDNRKTLLMEGVSNGLSMKFKFDKTGGEWKLKEIEY